MSEPAVDGGNVLKTASKILIPVLFVASAFAAEAPAPGAHPNVQITLTVGRNGGPAGPVSKVYKVLGQEGSISRMLMGWKAPIPTRSAEDPSGGPASMSYVYQNVGVSADLETTALANGLLFVSGQIEISGAREGAPQPAAGSKPPMIGTFQQALKIVVADGKKVRVAEGPDPEVGTLFVDLQVDVLK